MIKNFENKLLLENLKREHAQVTRLKKANKHLLRALELAEIAIQQHQYSKAINCIRIGINSAMECNI